MLDSSLGWCAKQNTVGQWLQIDLGAKNSVVGVVTQGRKDGWGGQHVKTFDAKYSVDGSTWVDVPGGTLTGGKAGNSRVTYMFPVGPVLARYVRLVVQTWGAHVTMRTGVLLNGKKFEGGNISNWQQQCTKRMYD